MNLITGRNVGMKEVLRGLALVHGRATRDYQKHAASAGDIDGFPEIVADLTGIANEISELMWKEHIKPRYSDADWDRSVGFWNHLQSTNKYRFGQMRMMARRLLDHYHLNENTACAIAAMRYAPYGQYLQTDHWQSIRVAFLCLYPVCVVCGTNKYLDVHHTTGGYDFRGRETPHSCKTLCHGHHKQFHGKKETL